ncbi:MAG: low specificity L-threonine aldolase [Alphaproteobacteria bacterium]|nr:low specificity L-threonine aldolase [Alphaproteobacteria bacterium]
MHFASDNASGASPRILDALNAANRGYAMPYGADDETRAAEKKLCELFERECAVFLTPTGTAANALALAAYTPPYGAVFCHEDAHVMDDECGAPEFFAGGAKLVGIAGRLGKIDPAGLSAALAAYPRGLVKQVQPAVFSLSQASESGTVYKPAEIAKLSELAHEKGVAVHMDGARFANALVALGCSPAEMSWKAGVDVLSFGATKNGAVMCEAVVFFNPDDAADFLFMRKRGGHTVSKARYLGAQMHAYLEDGHWLELAGRANGQARKLATGLSKIHGVRLGWPRQINELFVVLPERVNKGLRAAGAQYYDWGARGLPQGAKSLAKGERLARMVTCWATQDSEIEQFLDIARKAAG